MDSFIVSINMNNARKPSIYIIVTAALIFSGIFFIRHKNRLMPKILPPAVSYEAASISQTNDPAAPSADPILPAEINLAIPFTSQAPNQDWSQPYQQFCEEASTLMVASYVKNQSISGPSDADAKMLAIKDFETQKFGFYEDTNADETAVILREYFGLPKVEVISDPSAMDVKTAVAAGKAVIIPLAGRELGNPYYQNPGPLYHMLVVKGYKKNGDLITNDPGTRRGAGYIYKTDVIMNAIHDWNGGDVNAGRKVMIIVG